MSKKTTVKTLEDIAKLAGVSRGTVSRALRDSPLISEETKARIQAIAQTYQYQPNRVARNLRLQQSQTVALVIPIAPEARQMHTDPFLLRFLGLLGQALHVHGYHLLVTQLDLTQTLGAHLVQSGQVDGLVFLGRNHSNEARIAKLAQTLPLVVWGPTLPEQSYCSVGVDNIALAQTAVSHLLQQNRHKIGYIGLEPDCIEDELRREGYKQAHQTYGIAIDTTLQRHTSATSEAGYTAMQTLLAQTPTLDGVFVASDVMAMAAMSAIQESGRVVGQDVAVIGFDNVDIGQYSHPTLSTISQNLLEGVPLLVDKLLQLIAGNTVVSEWVNGRFISRQSS